MLSIVRRNPPLTIWQKNTNQDSDTTKRILKNTIKSLDLSVTVNEIKTMRGGDIVECDDNKLIQMLQNKAVAEPWAIHDVVIPKMINPAINVVCVREEYLKDKW